MSEKIVKVRFYVGTCYVGSEDSEIVEFDATDKTEEELKCEIEDYFRSWVWENIDAGWSIVHVHLS